MDKKEQILISELIGGLNYWLIQAEEKKEVPSNKIYRLNMATDLFKRFLKERDEK